MSVWCVEDFLSTLMDRVRGPQGMLRCNFRVSESLHPHRLHSGEHIHQLVWSYYSIYSAVLRWWRFRHHLPVFSLI